MTALPATELTPSLGRSAANGAFVPLLILCALAAALASPLWLLLVLPLVLGVPHVLGDLRVLWFQRAVPVTGKQALVVAAPLLAMTGLRALSLFGVATPGVLEVALGASAVAAGAAVGARSLAARERFVLPLLLASAVAISFPRATTLLLAHAHNVVAFVVFAGLARGRRGLGAPIAIYLTAWLCVLLAPGAGGSGEMFAGLGWTALANELTPGLDTAFQDRLLRSFAFAQAVHYGLWTWALPRARGTTLRSELGNAGFAIAVAACVLVPTLGLFDPVAVRSGYLSLAICHGWFELAALAFVLAHQSSMRKCNSVPQ
ncbi:MAG: hypothetical protein ABL997_17975 [Planctomycetota bacterium]